MKYYKVKKEYDNTRKNNKDIYIANELYTQKEVDRERLNTSYMDTVEINKNRTYFLFGARFECALD